MKHILGFLTAICILASALPRAVALEPVAEPEFDGYLVKYEENSPLPVSDELEYVAEGIYLVEDERLAKELSRSSEVEYVEPNYVATLFGDGVADGWGYSAMQATVADGLGLQGQGARIAVIDSGVDRESSDLEDAKILEGRCYMDWSAGNEAVDTDVSDDVGHGTIVTAMIVGDADEVGVTGVARQAEIVPLKCFKSGSSGTTAQLVQAIRDAYTTYQCNIINMSWGMKEDSQLLHDELLAAFNAGVVLVAAAGNISADFPKDTLLYPAGYSDIVIGVGSLDATLSVSGFSQKTGAVFVCAPGGAVYNGSGGTSYACPMVAGAAAVALARSDISSPAQLMELMRTTALDLGDVGRDASYGYGLVRFDLLLGGNWFCSLDADKGATVVGHAQDADGTVFAAAYSAEGRMQSIKSSGFDADGEFYKLKLQNSTTTAKIRLFFLDADGCPIRAREEF